MLSLCIFYKKGKTSKSKRKLEGLTITVVKANL